jgi:ankyrin repeat protein
MSSPHVDAIGRALYFAARGGDLARVHEALVNGSHNGSHFNWKNQSKSGQTALMAAAGGGHDQCVELILEAGALAVQEDNLGNTALHHAAWAGELACLDKLLEHRPTTGSSDIHWKNGAGQTALICGAQFGSVEVVTRLLEVGAAIDARDNDGNMSMHYAASDGHYDVVTLLLESGGRGDFVNADGLTPLDLARYNGHEDIAESLDQNVAQAPNRPGL